MADSPVGIKSKINQGTSLKTTPANSPVSRPGLRPLARPDGQQNSLSLRTIIGTTTTSSNGLASHYDSNSFAYCAGSAAVMAKINDGGEITSRFFRAQPTVAPVHPNISFYKEMTSASTPEKRRQTIHSNRHGGDERLGSPLRKAWGDDSSSKTWSARDRVKAASCVDLSPNGRFLAVGETGYSPRVNIFSIVPGGLSDVPLTTLTEHSFGVRCVAFSPNSRWLATLGDANDGFLFIWSINPKTGSAKLSLTNKCTAPIYGMAWCANNLITVGTRHVKVWRVGDPSSAFHTKQGRSMLEGDGAPSPAPKTLSGRNCRLGSLADSTFTCIAPISECEAILCTQKGIICLLDDRTGRQELKFLKQLQPSTQSAAVDFEGRRIWFASNEGRLQCESFESLRQAGGTHLLAGADASEEAVELLSCPSSPAVADAVPSLRAPPRSGSRRRHKRDGVIASRCLSIGIVSIDDEHNICVKRWGHGPDSELSTVMVLPAHTDAVHGVVSLPNNTTASNFITWSLGGTVNFWSSDGSFRRSEKVELEQPESSSADHSDHYNELRLIRVSAESQRIVSGDRLGVFQVINHQSWTATKVRAHSAEITDIALSAFGRSLLAATSSRDRTVQLLQYDKDKVKLLQTFDDHVGTVSAISFVANFLISASSDRTVIIRQKVLKKSHDGTTLLAYVPNRVITLKASPTSITSPEPDVLVVATMDRQIMSFSISTGAVVGSFKASDAEGEDAVILNSLDITSVEDNPNSRRILAGYSSTDKSIRLYDFARGVLLAKELGHTEGISDIAFLDHDLVTAEDDRRTLISTGLDGLIMIWNVSTAKHNLSSTPLQLQELSQGRAATGDDMDGTPIRDSLLRRPPLRKVMSKPDLADMSGLVSQGLTVGEQSPSRLTKKTSRSTILPRKLNWSSAEESNSRTKPSRGRAEDQSDNKRMESSCSASSTSTKHDTIHVAAALQQDMAHAPESSAEDGNPPRSCFEARSTSPRPAPPSLLTTPDSGNRANKGRLRRPPSIPADLRSQTHALTRRKSMGNISEVGSIAMASEQVCRTLRAYRKKIEAAPRAEELQLEELEVELLATLRAVEERQDRTGSRRKKAATDSDLDTLATLMKTSKLAHSSPVRPARSSGRC